MARIPVRLPHTAYDVIVERGSLQRTAEHLNSLVSGRQVLVVTSGPVWRHQGTPLERGLQGLHWKRLAMPDGEEHKRLSTVEALADQLLAAGADRTSVVLAFGGGVVNDVAGFLAAIYMRGIEVIQVPTTLLAQVDAAIGGKTGVNLAEGKNLIGSFHQPKLVLVDPAALETLPEREFRAGLYEVIKCGIIRSRALFDLLASRRDQVLQRTPEVVDELITESVRIKADVVSADEKESDLRRILNFGHTLGHALEAETGYGRFLHGEAVSFGMRAAVNLAESAGVLGDAEGASMRRLIDDYGPIPSLSGIRAEALLARVGNDKKTLGGRLHFVLPDRVGSVRVFSGLAPDLIRTATEQALAATS
jgi:3-dehydroquinate synthase